MPLIRRRAQLAVKIETTAGTEIALLAADVKGNVFDPIVNPVFETIDRPKQGDFGMFQSSLGTYGATCTFRTELVGDGLTTTPTMMETLLPCCGWLQTVDTWAPSSEAVGSNVKTCTIGLYQDGRRHVMFGCVGTFVMNFENGKPISIDWTFTGIWTAPDDTALLSPSLVTDLPMRWAASTTTIGGVATCMQSLSIDAGNTIILRECHSTASGFKTGLIVDRQIMITCNPEAVLVATDPHYADVLAMTSMAFALQVSDSTDTIDIDAAAVQIVNAQQGDRGGMVIDDLTLKVLNDSLTIAWS